MKRGFDPNNRTWDEKVKFLNTVYRSKVSHEDQSYSIDLNDIYHLFSGHFSFLHITKPSESRE